MEQYLSDLIAIEGIATQHYYLTHFVVRQRTVRAQLRAFFRLFPFLSMFSLIVAQVLRPLESPLN